MILGNIGSGKSTTCKALAKSFPDFAVLSLDKIRAELFEIKPDQSARDRDSEANELLFNRCMEEADHFILENVGTSKGFSRLCARLKLNRVFIYKVLIKCPPNIAYDRWQARGQFSTQIGPAMGDPFKIKDYISVNDYNLSLNQYDIVVDTEKLSFQAGIKLIEDKFRSDFNSLQRFRR
jgi:dephospho-CoA kinase